MTKSLSSKYGKKSLNTEIMSAPDSLRTALGGTLQKTAETTSGLVQKKIAQNIISATSQKVSSKSKKYDQKNDNKIFMSSDYHTYYTGRE